MLEAMVLVYACALGAPAMLLILLFWTGVERYLEERRKAASIMARMQAPAAAGASPVPPRPPRLRARAAPRGRAAA